MQDHSVVLKAESSLEFGVRGCLTLVHNSVGQDVCDPLIEIVCPFYITLVELEMGFQSLIGYAVQTAQVELPRVLGTVNHFSSYSPGHSLQFTLIIYKTVFFLHLALCSYLLLSPY